jgi:hypothetical protein
MGNKLTKSFILFLMVMLSFAFVGVGAFALVPQDHVVMVSAQVQQVPPSITLTWSTPPTAVTGYTVYRKAKEATSWGATVATLSSATLQYVDTNVSIGVAYEYKISSDNGNGYICAGIMLPEVASRGKVVLIVDSSYTSSLVTELERLKNDLVGDGWLVLRHDVSLNSTPQQVKALIKADYDADPQNVKAVFLLGRIPICHSGYFAPDGHDPRSWPADTYYGDMDGVWADNDNNGAMDQNYIPSDIELQVGRVDLSGLESTFTAISEVNLVRRYLDKDHNYRMGLMNLQMRGFVEDGFGERSGEAFSRNAYGNFPQLCNGQTPVYTGVWKTTLLNQEYIWSYINGGGTASSVPGLSSSDLVSNSYKTVFTMMFGSYLGQWDKSDDLLRSFLGMPTYGLTNVWGGRPNWFFHHMGLGDNIGYSTKLTQNNGGLYNEPGTAPRGIHISLMGDPTLRMYAVKPPSNVSATIYQAGTSRVTWTAPTVSVLGYKVYRSESANGPFECITPNIVTNTYFDDSTIQEKKTYVYMVKAVTLETTPSGTFYNQSQGSTYTLMIPSTNTIVITNTVNATIDYDKKEVTISGTTSAGEGSAVTVKVVDPLNNTNYIEQTVSGVGGAYSVVYTMATKIPNTYNVYVGGETFSLPMNKVFKAIPIEQLSFCDANGNPLQALPHSGVLQIKAVITNSSASSFNSQVILAVYSSDKILKKITFAEKLIASSQSDTLIASFDINNWATGDFAKAFVVENFQSMRSLGNFNVLDGN